MTSVAPISNDTKSLYQNITNPKPKQNTAINNTQNNDTFEKQKENKPFTKKIKDYLFTPIDNPQYGKTRPQGQTTRFQNILGVTFLAAIYGFLFFTMYKDNKNLSQGIDETQKTLAKMNSKTQKLSEFMEGYKENLDKASELKDLALPNDLKETIERLMNRIKNPQAFVEKGGVTNNAILLYGPPGTGKTTVAKAITREIKNAELFSVDLSTIQGSLVGESEKNLDKVIKNTCQYAKLNPNKKIVLLMDEFDSVAIKDNGSSNQQFHASLLNVLKRGISEKLSQHDNIILIATTNAELEKTQGLSWVQTLDSAIADRFGEQIRVERPTAEQFARAIANHYKGLEKVEDVLKNETNTGVIDIAKQLADNKRSFRTLNTLFKNSAETEGEKLTLEDVLKTLKSLLSKSSSDTNTKNDIHITGFAG